jgi:hypothetical protein
VGILNVAARTVVANGASALSAILVRRVAFTRKKMGITNLGSIDSREVKTTGDYWTKLRRVLDFQTPSSTTSNAQGELGIGLECLTSVPGWLDFCGGAVASRRFGSA